MTIYYRSRELVISREEFVTLFGPDRFALTDLTDIRIGRGNPDPSRRTVTHASAGALVLALAAGPLIDSPAAWALVAVTILGSAGVGGMSLLFRRPRWQLYAFHHGMNICLYSTTDAQTFGQVRRGLIRALEANDRVPAKKR
jgi:hypothetical protein